MWLTRRFGLLRILSSYRTFSFEEFITFIPQENVELISLSYKQILICLRIKLQTLTAALRRSCTETYTSSSSKIIENNFLAKALIFNTDFSLLFSDKNRCWISLLPYQKQNYFYLGEKKVVRTIKESKDYLSYVKIFYHFFYILLSSLCHPEKKRFLWIV